MSVVPEGASNLRSMVHADSALALRTPGQPARFASLEAFAATLVPSTAIVPTPRQTRFMKQPPPGGITGAGDLRAIAYLNRGVR